MKRVLVIRNDKLGDFVSALPAIQILRLAMPQAHISVLVSSYTAPLANSCSTIDTVLIDPSCKSLNTTLKLLRMLRRCKFDGAITLFSTTRTGIAAQLAGIPYRLSPATKIAQIFYNHRLVQHRSRSEKPEYEYNLDLVRKFLADQGIKDIPEPQPPFLSFDREEILSLRQTFCKQYGIDPAHRLLFVHPGHGGSAGHLSLDKYASLIEGLASPQPFTVVLSAGPDELELVKELSVLISKTPHVIYHSTEGLVRFAQHIAFADLFIAGSTGPLHISGALNVPTAGFYTRRRSATALRWQTLNSPERRLAFSPPPEAGEEDMEAIDVKAAAAEISRCFLAAPPGAAS